MNPTSISTLNPCTNSGNHIQLEHLWQNLSYQNLRLSNLLFIFFSSIRLIVWIFQVQSNVFIRIKFVSNLFIRLICIKFFYLLSCSYQIRSFIYLYRFIRVKFDYSYQFRQNVYSYQICRLFVSIFFRVIGSFV